MKPWREVAAPHSDVLEGTFLQSEFAADITAVRDGKAMPEYQDAARFFERTFITEGMRLLLVQVAQRINQRKDGHDAKDGHHRKPLLAQQQHDKLGRDQDEPACQQKTGAHQQRAGAKEGLGQL